MGNNSKPMNGLVLYFREIKNVDAKKQQNKIFKLYVENFYKK